MKLSTIIKILLGIIVLGLLFFKVGIDEITSTFSTINPLYLPAIIILFVTGLIMGAYNLKIFSDAIGIKIKFKEMLNYSLSSWAFGLIIPGKVGEFSFVYLAKKHMTIGQGMAISVLDKITTVISLCVLAFFGFFIFFDLQKAIYITGLTTAAVIIGLAFLLSSLGRKIIKRILGKYGEMFSGFSKTLTFLIFQRKKELSVNFAITFLKWGITAILTYMTFLSFGQTLNPLIILTISATVMLLSLIPITMSGLGIKEGAAVFLYGLIGVPAAITMSVHIILLLMNYAGAAMVFLLIKNR